MAKTIIGLLLSGVVSGVATQVAAAPVSDDAAGQLLNRLNQLEQEVSTLRGQNQELRNHVDTLKKDQKDGFLQVDERVQKLEPKDKEAEAKTSSIEDKANTRTVSKLQELKPLADEATGGLRITLPPDPVGVASAEKISPDSPDSYYYYGTDKSEEKPADKPIKPEEPPAATSLRSSDVTPSAPLLPNEDADQTDVAAGEAYNAAYKLLLERPSESIAAFEGFLKNYPTHPLAPNAQYWLAEALYSQKQYARSTDEFLKVLQRYKTSSKAPDAALKMGYAFYELHNWNLARRSLEDTVQFFPDSNASRLAQARLEQLTTEGH